MQPIQALAVTPLQVLYSQQQGLWRRAVAQHRPGQGLKEPLALPGFGHGLWRRQARPFGQHLGQQAGHFTEPDVLQGRQGTGLQQGGHRGVGQFALGGVATGVGALDPLPFRPMEQLLHQSRFANAGFALQ